MRADVFEYVHVLVYCYLQRPEVVMFPGPLQEQQMFLLTGNNLNLIFMTFYFKFFSCDVFWSFSFPSSPQREGEALLPT